MEHFGVHVYLMPGQTNDEIRLPLEGLNIRYYVGGDGQHRTVSLLELLRVTEDIAKRGLRTDMSPTIVNVSSDGMYMHLTNYFRKSEEGLKSRIQRVLGILPPEKVQTGTSED